MKTAKKEVKSKFDTYATLFSGAGIGCYGFNMERYKCVGTAELLEKRIKYQKINKVGISESAYVCGDLSDEKVFNKLKNAISENLKLIGKERLDVLIATPPCQGMSVANHKKSNELPRNSLVIESIKLIEKINPHFFVLENVPSFLKTICLDDDEHKTIELAINHHLSKKYKIFSKKINFAYHGSQSSRTRCLVIGVSIEHKHINPSELFPSEEPPQTLRELISDLPKLSWGEICKDDIYHSFRTYKEHMRHWIKDLSPGQSAFDNKNPNLRPHKIVDGKIVENKNGNGDKYKRQLWDKLAPCVHTRNDILASQNTIHPTEDRVFSIRELMRMMTIPMTFNFLDDENANRLTIEEKKDLIKKEELNIRHSIGESVPTEIFRKIARNISDCFKKNHSGKKRFDEFIFKTNCQNQRDLSLYIQKHKFKEYSLNELLIYSELLNTSKEKDAAFYTKPDIVDEIVGGLPNFSTKKKLKILEPSVGSGCFIFKIIEKYSKSHKLEIDACDINSDALSVLTELIKALDIKKTVKINLFHEDFLLKKFSSKYDLVIGNPPFGKIESAKKSLNRYLIQARNKDTKNIYVYFLEKSIDLGEYVSLIVPKSILGPPELNLTREELERYSFERIIDFGEKGFSGVLIETVSLNFLTVNPTKNTNVCVKSMILDCERQIKQSKIMDKTFPTWLLYRDDFFDSVQLKMTFGKFTVFRDRQITTSLTTKKGKYRVIKAANIGNAEILDFPEKDLYLDDINGLSVSKFLDVQNLILVPNLSYLPRACIKPKGIVVDGSAALLIPLEKKLKLSKKQLNYFAEDEYRKFYKICRNYSTRSMNIDSNYVHYFGVLNDQ
jgi:DNA (cytosine-5)-methyltransferase 1